MKKITKQDIIDHLTMDHGLHRSSAIRAVEGIINIVSNALAAGSQVSLRGFGTIKVVEIPEKVARDINTGTPLTVPAHRTARLILSTKMKHRMNSDGQEDNISDYPKLPSSKSSTSHTL